MDQKIDKKKVKFSNTALMILVPTRYDYFCAGITNDLWYNIIEFNNMKTELNNELMSNSINSNDYKKYIINMLYTNDDEKNE